MNYKPGTTITPPVAAEPRRGGWPHILLIIGTGLLPFVLDLVWPSTTSKVHDVVWLLLVVPAYLSAYYWGLKGSVLSSIASAVLVIVFERWELTAEPPLVQELNSLEIILALYTVTMGLALGLLAERLIRQKQQLRALAEQWHERAHLDPVTNLANRAAFEATLAAAILQAQVMEGSVGLLLVDVNDFKRCNDRCGHPTGDRVLRLVGATLVGAIRSGDLACRIGGDEFAVVLPGSDESAVRLVASRITDHLRGLACPVVGSGCAITVAIGVAVLPVHAGNAGDLIAHADAAMYASKKRRAALPGNGKSEVNP